MSTCRGAPAPHRCQHGELCDWTPPVDYETLARIAPTIRGHEGHRWRQVGRCVYCECKVRLYQGTVPDGHPTFTPPRQPSSADKMRERWGRG